MSDRLGRTRALVGDLLNLAAGARALCAGPPSGATDLYGIGALPLNSIFVSHARRGQASGGGRLATVKVYNELDGSLQESIERGSSRRGAFGCERRPNFFLELLTPRRRSLSFRRPAGWVYDASSWISR